MVIIMYSDIRQDTQASIRFSATIANLVNTLHENYCLWHLYGLSNQGRFET